MKSVNKGDKKQNSAGTSATNSSEPSMNGINGARGLFDINTHCVARKQQIRSSEISRILRTTKIVS